MRRFIVGITGASGSLYAVKLIENLLANPEHQVHLVISNAGARVMADELPGKPQFNPFEARSFLNLSDTQIGRLHLERNADIGAGPASGTWPVEAMIVCPCSVKTVGSLAAGLADTLISRAGDVTLKEGRPLVLVVRETPFSLIHLRNMTSLAEAGAVILPAAPGFYHKPATIDDLVGHVVQKVFDRLRLDYPGAVRWGEK